MNMPRFFLRTAWHNLLRGGQRSLVALLCIAFGVMSLTAMLLVSHFFTQAMALEPGEHVGADISLTPQKQDFISGEQLAELAALREAGEIERFTLIAYTSSLTYRTSTSGEMFFASAGMGIETELYPLTGDLILSQPGNIGLTTLLQESGDVIVTRDIAEELDLELGDSLILADLRLGFPVRARIQGIAADTPNHQGSKIYYAMATAQELRGGGQYANTALVNASDPQAAGLRLEESGAWQVFPATVAAESGRQSQELFVTLLKGAGILGLLVGGIGVANTMQVLLRRRQKEVAIWKALGYREIELQALFAGEAALLGILGSLLGVGAGVGVSAGLMHLFGNTSNLLVAWTFSPYPLIAGGLSGVFTTVCFALWAIVSTSQARPMALLRDEPVLAEGMPWLKALGLALLIGLPFSVVTSFIMGSLLKGIGVVLFAAAGLVVLGGALGVLAWLVARALPLSAWPLARLAGKSFRRRGMSLVFAMIALFTGIVAMTFGVVVTQNAQRTMDERSIPVEGYNIHLIAPFSQARAMREAVAGQDLVATAFEVQVPVVDIVRQEADGPAPVEAVLIGRSEPGEYNLEGATWGSRPEGVYAYRYTQLPVGSLVNVTLQDGSTRKLEIVGTYDLDFELLYMAPQLGLLAPIELVTGLAEPETARYFVQARTGQVGRVSRELGEALPEVTVINLVAFAARFTRTYHNLFLLAVAMSGLALVAGALLVANSVSLAMLDRRYEIGVLKAVGYSRAHILTALAVEYSLAAVVATGAGLLAVQIFLMIVSRANQLAGSLLILEPSTAGLIAASGLILVLLAVLAVTWGPTRLSPTAVLNERV